MVVTESSRLNIVTTDPVGGSRISFRLAEERNLGFFMFFSRSQMLTASLARDFGEMPTNTFCQLSIAPVEFKTRNGIFVRYLRPIFTTAQK